MYSFDALTTIGAVRTKTTESQPTALLPAAADAVRREDEHGQPNDVAQHRHQIAPCDTGVKEVGNQ